MGYIRIYFSIDCETQIFAANLDAKFTLVVYVNCYVLIK